MAASDCYALTVSPDGRPRKVCLSYVRGNEQLRQDLARGLRRPPTSEEMDRAVEGIVQAVRGLGIRGRLTSEQLDQAWELLGRSTHPADDTTAPHAQRGPGVLERTLRDASTGMDGQMSVDQVPTSVYLASAAPLSGGLARNLRDTPTMAGPIESAFQRAAPTAAEVADAWRRRRITPGQMNRLMEGLKEPLFPIPGARRVDLPGGATDAAPAFMQVAPEFQRWSPAAPLEIITPRELDIFFERLRQQELLNQRPLRDREIESQVRG